MLMYNTMERMQLSGIFFTFLNALHKEGVLTEQYQPTRNSQLEELDTCLNSIR